jgi:hypothetical protein
MKLPKLPNPASVLDAKYTAEQMRAYATKATFLEREACAKVCEDSVEYAGGTLAEAIRARSKA